MKCGCHRCAPFWLGCQWCRRQWPTTVKEALYGICSWRESIPTLCTRNSNILENGYSLFVFSHFRVMLLLIPRDPGVYIHSVCGLKRWSLHCSPLLFTVGEAPLSEANTAATDYPARLASAVCGGHDRAQLPAGVAGELDQAKQREGRGQRTCRCVSHQGLFFVWSALTQGPERLEREGLGKDMVSDFADRRAELLPI